MARELAEADHGVLRLHMHPGQWRAWESTRRYVCVIAGTQSGKTSWGPHWLYREIQRRGPGDYMVVTPTFQLLELKALPEFRRLFETLLQLGRYVASPVRKFVFSTSGSTRTHGRSDESTNVYFGYAADPDSLESATVKAVWADEAGQKKFKLASLEALRRRCAIHRGRMLFTTTPYDLGWLKQQMYDKFKAGDDEIDVIRFDSTENPQFPIEEFESAKRSLPPWKFNMFYRGMFERPAGLIYDLFDPVVHTCPRFALPGLWPRYLGLDFGGVNTAGVFLAGEPGTSRVYLYREYKAGGRTAAEHAYALLKGEPHIPRCVGGSRSEGQWRNEFAAAGLPVYAPEISDVEVGIDRVYGATRRNELIVFSDCAGVLEQLQTYSRVLDSQGEPTEEIEDKATFHYLDSLRYIVSDLRSAQQSWTPSAMSALSRKQAI